MKRLKIFGAADGGVDDLDEVHGAESRSLVVDLFGDLEQAAGVAGDEDVSLAAEDVVGFPLSEIVRGFGSTRL